MGDGGPKAASHPAGPDAVTGAAPRARTGAERARTLYYIAALVLAALIPLILTAGLWVRAAFDQNERDLQSFLTTQVSRISARLDAEIDQQISVLRAIASVQSLDEPNLPMFQLTAERMVAVIPQWAGIALVDPVTGAQLANTLRPVGPELPLTTTPEIVRQVAERREPAVHTRYPGEGGVYNQGAILLYVPVIRDNVVRSVLVAGMGEERVQQILLDNQADGLLTVVVDEQERILARSRRHEAFFGRQANEQLRTATAGRGGGYFVAETLDSNTVFTAFIRSSLTGWLAVAATDQREFETLNERSTWALIGTGALSLTLAGVLAVFLFYNVVERRVNDERFAASRALGELDARLLTATQQSLEEQRKAASEREVLLREIYHRVKNNLQIIQSLLRLGSRNLKAEQREPFEAAIRRIGAMARVHTLLYKSPDLASIDFKDYLEDVVRETSEGLGADLRGIATELDSASMRVPLDTAVPLAFITVEILTNAFKHAFPNRRRGTVTVTARQEGEHGVLTIADNGVGLPPEPTGKRPLGLTLVTKLVEQIGGTLETPPAGQSTYRVTFPLTAPSQANLPPGVGA